MDRPTVIAGQIPLETDILRAAQYAMVGNAKTNEAILGLPTYVSGFTLVPTSPASLVLTLGAGIIFQQENLEASPWSSMPADTHTIVKQGIMLDAASLTFTPPTTVGFSQVFLVEVQYQDVDTGAVVRPYYNAANPAVQFNGPGGAGTADNTTRKGAVAYQIKAGTAALSGTQTAPSPDAGWAGLYIVTIAQGATTITAGNIAQYSAAPFIPVTLPLVPRGVQAGIWITSPDTGTANAYIASLTTVLSSPLLGTQVELSGVLYSNTGASTLAFGGVAYPIVRNDGSTLQLNDIPAGFWPIFRYDGARFRLMNVPFSSVRTNLTAPLTVYVRTDGNDANNGLANTSASAFLTIQGAWNRICQIYTFNGFKVTIQLGIPGTYAGAYFTDIGVNGNIFLSGNTSTPSSYIITQAPGSAPNYCIAAAVGTLKITGVYCDFSAATTGNAIWSNSGGFIVVGPTVTAKYTGSSSGAGLLCVDGGGQMATVGAVTLLGSGTLGNVIAINAGGVYLGGIQTGGGATTMTVTNLTYSVFCLSQDGAGYWQNTTITASGNTGTRYSALLNGVINTLGAGPSFFPGTVAGTLATGGQYA